MRRFIAALATGAAVALVGLVLWWPYDSKQLTAEQRSALYALPLESIAPTAVYHLGHSLVGRDMPAMLAQLSGHSYASQLGWGTSLKAHWEDDVEINGFEQENDHDRFRPAKTAMASGEYDVVVLTELVEIEAAIAYFDAPEYLYRWTDAARQGNPDVRVYLYETWHDLEDPQGWLTRLDMDAERYWEGVLTAQAMGSDPENRPIYIIPAGRVLAELTRRVESAGGVGNMASRQDLFAVLDDGSPDTIHLNDLGNYLVALTHFAVLTHKTPVGLPHKLKRADGASAQAPSPELAELMQQTVWDVVTHLPQSGVPSP